MEVFFRDARKSEVGYRIREGHVEFQRGDGTWRVLNAEDVQLHLVLHTEVSQRLFKYQTEMKLHKTPQNPPVDIQPHRLTYSFCSVAEDQRSAKPE